LRRCRRRWFAKERHRAISSVGITLGVVEEGTKTRCRVETANGVLIERFKTKAGVPDAAWQKANQNPNAISVVAVGQRTVRICGFRIWQKPTAGQRQRDRKQTANRISHFCFH
jgi:hypothetical protein